MGIFSGLVGAATEFYNQAESERAHQKADDRLWIGERLSVEDQNRTYNRIRDDYQPYRDLGTQGVNAMMDPNQSFEKSPGYQFRMNEGMRNLENRFSAGSGGGNAMRALNDYGQGMASQEFGNWWNRQAGMAGMGMGATGNVATADMNRAGNIGSYRMRGAENRAGVGLHGAKEQADYRTKGWSSLMSGYDDWRGMGGNGTSVDV